ncbi:MAG TPA: hypothetical protein VLC28_16670, partial [Flavitalea sp.]|nr:hypothetical protein [Flavitalea sp.]
MKTFTSVCIVLILSFNAFSQRSKITMSDEFKVVENDFRHRTVSHSVYHNNAFFTVNNSGISKAKWLFTKLYDLKFSITLSKFDGKMNTIKEFDIEQGEKIYGPVPPE